MTHRQKRKGMKETNRTVTLTIEEILGDLADTFHPWIMKYPDSKEAKDSALLTAANPRGDLTCFANYLKRYFIQDEITLRLKSIGANLDTLDEMTQSIAEGLFNAGNSRRRETLHLNN